eukprot:TRINITY_DN11063_c0_g2_i1.p1 TRINITY_DN11063_c0_g2~~TRINITY_DN11063_c0_g2_i1.p1  ORF type:complete len:225 (+),score=26.64 TRINITY_DN11063_c0_g2_i1:121-795(+)
MVSSLAFSRASLRSPARRLVGQRCKQAGRLVASMATKTALVPVANGSEEMETVIIVDVLRRAQIDVTVASVEDQLQVTASRSVKLVADKLIAEAQGEYDVIALPGGMPGAERLGQCAVLTEMLQKQKEAGKLYAAICAAPAIVFEPQGLVSGLSVTSHPGFVDKLSNQSAVEERVVVDGTCTTSRGPGTAFEFALSLVQQLCGDEVMSNVAGPMVMYEHCTCKK